MSGKLLLVDGMNLLFQMFFGMPSRIFNSQGRAIHGTMGFTGALRRMLEMTEPSHVLVVFDGEHGNPRTRLSAEYKANRPDFTDVPEEENPFSQLPDIYRVLDGMGIRHCETEDCEADDMIAAYAAACRSTMDIVVSSFDSDFFQLIGPGVSVMRYRGEKTVVCDEAWLTGKYGIEGRSYVDFKSLTGDAADNIRGIDGVGPKTAAALVNRFGTIENLIKEYTSIENRRLRGLIGNGLDRLPVNKALIKMDECARMPYKAEELEFSGRPASTREILTAAGLLP
ncbi:MAG: hypothetical protein J5775_04370 [Spirochaetales bacterium]|nr:hypothetical protein [Spirochaetales bacterium]